MTNNILINQYKDAETYGEPAKVIEMTLDTPKRANVAEMHFVIKEGGRCSVSLSRGTQAGMAELTTDFINVYSPKTLVNQVSSVSELKAMYRAGLRLPMYVGNFSKKYMNLKESLEYLAKKQSVMMILFS